MNLAGETVLGIDIGRVIIGGRGKDDTSFFSDGFLQTPEIPHAIDSIAKLVELFDDVVLVSKCGEIVAHKAKTWLYWHKFPERTGISLDSIYTCRERHEKAPICAQVGITHFIDDKLDVLRHMDGIVEHQFLFQGRTHDINKHRAYLTKVIQVASWDAILKHFGLTRWD